jgi:hypothetical protein
MQETDGALAAYREAAERCNEVIVGCDDLSRRGVRSPRNEPAPSRRWLLVHLIEETARHAGHADASRSTAPSADRHRAPNRRIHGYVRPYLIPRVRLRKQWRPESLPALQTVLRNLHSSI